MSTSTETFSLDTIEVTMLPELQGWKEKQLAIVKENPFVAIVDNKTYEEAKKARTTFVSARTTIEKQEKLLASKLKDVRTKIGDFSNELIGLTLPHEEKQQEEVRRYEAVKEAERLEKERLEQVRKDKILSEIDAIYQSRKLEIQNLTFDKIESFKSDFNTSIEMDVTPFEEFELQFISKIQLLQDQLQDRIQILTQNENQRIEAERLEKERAELEAQRKADADKLAKEKAEFEAEKQAKEEADIKAKADADARQKAIDDANAQRQAELDAQQKAIDDAEAKRKAEIEEEAEAKRIAELEVVEEKAEVQPVQFDLPKTIRKIILDTVDDLAGSFLFYDRKEDADLPTGAIEKALKNGDIKKEEIIEAFANHINKIEY